MQEFEKSTSIDEAEQIMVRLEENLTKVESNLNKTPFWKKQKVRMSTPCIYAYSGLHSMYNVTHRMLMQYCIV